MREPVFGKRVVEAAPARRRIRAFALALAAGFFVLGARAAQLAAVGPDAPRAAAQAAPEIRRADLLDRNGALLATSVPAYTLTAEPGLVWDAKDAARQIARALPGIDRAALERRLAATDKRLVYLARGLTPRQRAAVFDLGLAGVDFEEDRRRVYPQARLAAHLLGGVDQDRMGAAGVERGLDAAIRRAGEKDQPVRLALDVRVQHAMEEELAAAMAVTQAASAAGILVDGRTGEVLALASLPDFDPNAPPSAAAPARRNQAAGQVYEMGSTMKPFTVAAGLDAGVVGPRETFDLGAPYVIAGRTIRDMTPYAGSLPLDASLARSSNIAVAEIALRLGAERQRAALERLGLLERAGLELPESARPLAPGRTDPLSVAVLGYGHGMAVSLASVAGAYTAFVNEGSRVRLTLAAVPAGETVATVAAVSPEAAAQTLAMMRKAVVEGTGRRADVAGLEIAGKTGTAEKLDDGRYVGDRNYASFAAVFPASAPKYVMVLALDEPQSGVEAGDGATGGGAAAPAAARLARRIAPFLDLKSAPPLVAEKPTGVTPAQLAQGGGP